MPIDLSWLIGRRVRNVEKKDFSWFITLDDSSSISTEACWRLVTDRVVVSSQDHGQLFGLKAPVDAAAVIVETVGQMQVERFSLDKRTADLSLEFEGGAIIQFLTASGGYEGWRTEHEHQSVICLGGGELAIFDRM